MAYTTINKSTDYFNTKLYTGNGSTQTISGVGHQPDMTWVKVRSETGSHRLADAVRGYTKYIFPNGTDAEGTSSTNITSWNSDGFALGNGSINENTRTYASWNWKAGGGQGSSNTAGSINTTYTSVNTTAGCSISSYTGNGSAGATVGHGLGVAPKVVITKRYDGGTNNWVVGHGAIGFTEVIYLNSTSSKATDSGSWNNTAPSSTVFTVGSNNESNGNGYEFISYCFAEKPGYSKFGKYTGNGNDDGSFIYTGFKPSFILVKDSNADGVWELFDNKRTSYNGLGIFLRANSSASEITDNNYPNPDFLSNGIKWRSLGGGVNDNGHTYIYMAIGQTLVGSNNVPCTAR